MLTVHLKEEDDRPEHTQETWQQEADGWTDMYCIQNKAEKSVIYKLQGKKDG